MAPKIKNIIIFVVIGIVFISVYFYFTRSSSETPALMSSTGTTDSTALSAEEQGIAQDFLVLLLSVKNIKLNDGIFADPAFAGLRDSSIILTPDGNEGRPNPFAPFGIDVESSTSTTSTSASTGSGSDASLPASSTTPAATTPATTPSTTAPAKPVTPATPAAN